MKKYILKSLLFIGFFSISTISYSNVKKCYVKIGLSDCINCYYALELIKNIDKTYILKKEHEKLIQDIFKQKIGIDTNNLKIISSDSIYNLISKDDFSSISIIENDKILFQSELILFSKNFDKFNTIYKSSTKITNENSLDLNTHYHKECDVKILKNKTVVIADPIKNQIKKLDENSNLIYQIDIEKLTEKIFKISFDSLNYELNSIKNFYLKYNIIKNITNISKLDVYDNNTYLLLNSKIIKINNYDTILSGFYTIIKLSENNKISIYPIEAEILTNKYYANENLFYVQNNENIVLDVICPDINLKPYLYSNYVLNNKKFVFSSFSIDTIPNNLTNNRNYNYRITPFAYSENYIAFQIQMKLFLQNNEIIELRKVKFNRIDEIFKLKHSLNDIYKNNNYIYLSISNDTSHLIQTYNIINKKIENYNFKIDKLNSNTFVKFDKNGNYFYINSTNKLIIKPL